MAPAVFLATPSAAGAPLIHLKDTKTHISYLVDTGAAISLLPFSSSQHPSGSGPKLVNASGASIPSWNFVFKNLKFGNHTFVHSFLQSAVSQPILGMDFLSLHDLQIDLKHSKVLFPSSTPRPSPTFPVFPSILPSIPVLSSMPTPPPPTSTSPPSLASSISSLLGRFSSVTSPPTSSWPKPKHQTKHFLHTTGPPLFSRSRRLSPEQLKVAEQEFAKLERLGIIRRSSAPWATPLHMVPKATGGWRPCGDYRRVNAATIPDKYPLPNLQDLSSHLHGAKIFSKLDLEKGYYQVPMNEDDIPKTAIITPFGLFEFLFMPFGLMNAAQTFQRLMDSLFRPFPFLFIYLDDFLIFSDSPASHLSHLEQVLSVLSENGLHINPDKCIFGSTEIDFLGHHVTPAGLSPISSHVQPIIDFPPPSNVKALQRFLGMLNFYRPFLPGIARVLKPLTDATKGTGTLSWTPVMQTSFLASKSLLASAVPLHHPSPTAVLSLATDASDSHVGAVLQQRSSSSWQPLAFYSHKLSPAESRYSTFDRELLAAFLSVRHFRFLLEGRPFTLFTDHKPLISAISKSNTPFSSRQQRHLSFLSEFTTDFVHLPGSQNVVADVLSRPCPAIPAINLVAPSSPSSLFPLPFSYLDVAKAQQACPSIPILQALPSLSIIAIPLSPTVSLLGDVSTPTFRPLIPLSFRRQIFDHIHTLGHPGIKATRRLVSSRFLWHSMAKDLTLWAGQCVLCQKSKIHVHVSPPPVPIPIPSRRFSHIHIDIVGPLPSSQGQTHILTMIDRTTRWPEAVPLSSTTASACAEAFCSSWISRFGVPHTITSDRGSQFTSAIWSQICSLLNLSHITTTSFHPQSNGMVERFHRSLKSTLRARCTTSDWSAHLPWFLLSFRSSPHDITNLSPAEAVFGSPLILPGQFLASPEDDTSQFLTKWQSSLSGSLSVPPAPSSVPPHIPPSLLHSPFVFVRAPPSHPPLSPSYSGPYKVLRRSPRSFVLQLGSRSDSVSVHRLKPAHLPPDTLPALPPKRGRPARPSPTVPTPLSPLVPVPVPLPPPTTHPPSPPSILRSPNSPSSKSRSSVHFLNPNPSPSSRPVRIRTPTNRFSNFHET